jgi:hypothetical protein
MAIMHPNKVPEFFHAYSETKFFNACKEQLSDKYLFSTQYDGTQQTMD